MRIHYSTIQWFPPRLADVAELFSVELAKRGVELSWYANREGPGGAAILSFNGQPCRVPPKLGWNTGLFKLINRLLYWLCDLIETFRQLRNPPDIFVARDKFIGALGCLIAARVSRRCFVYWMSYPFLEHHIQHAESRSFLRRMLALVLYGGGRVLLYKILLPGADHIFVQSDAMKVREGQKGVPIEKMTVVPMGVKADALTRTQRTFNTGTKTIAYLGTLARIRKLEVLIDAMALVLERHPDALLLMIGDGNVPSERVHIIEYSKRVGIEDRVRFTGYLPTDKAWSLVQSADICVSPIRPDPILDVGSPTKLVEYMALAKPVVANDHPDQARVLEESKAGICVKWDAGAFADAIVDLLDQPEVAREMGRRGPDWVRSNRIYPTIADNVHAQLRCLVQMRS